MTLKNYAPLVLVGLGIGLIGLGVKFSKDSSVYNSPKVQRALQLERKIEKISQSPLENHISLQKNVDEYSTMFLEEGFSDNLSKYKSFNNYSFFTANSGLFLSVSSLFAAIQMRRKNT